MNRPGPPIRPKTKMWAFAHWCASPTDYLHNSSSYDYTPRPQKRQTEAGGCPTQARFCGCPTQACFCGCPTQARFWLEWGSSLVNNGSSTDGHSFPAALSRLRAVHSHSISTRPSHPVAHGRKLLSNQSSGRAHNPRFTGLLCMYLSFSANCR
jgi:hypothetical protein